jgi:two-component system, NtrC family, nitrogen regulation sensor histidine kinase NtrY
MNILKKLELEWKILILACVLFGAFAWPVQQLYVNRLTATLHQSIDPQLDSLLHAQLQAANASDREMVVASLERHRQWRALIPIIVREQRRTIVGFSVLLFLVLFILALWTLRALTRPLKNLARAVSKIGKGERAAVRAVSGGALGTVESAVAALQDELDVLRQKAQLQGMEKAWQDIARVMAHEIKNPLTPMRLTLDRMEEKSLANEPIAADTMKVFLGRLNDQIDVLERLVDHFRSFSREPEAVIRPVALAEQVRASSEGMGAKMTTAISGNATVLADPYLLNQVLLNIWKNSLEAGATAMEVTVRERTADVLLSIRDNGPGIDAANLDRVWLPYVSFKQGGTGLGLAVVKRLVEAMGGTVSLLSSRGPSNHGLTVCITLPRTKKGDPAHG